MMLLDIGSFEFRFSGQQWEKVVATECSRSCDEKAAGGQSLDHRHISGYSAAFCEVENGRGQRNGEMDTLSMNCGKKKIDRNSFESRKLPLVV